jgi:hypothetical protein
MIDEQLIAEQLQVFLGPDSPAVQVTRFPADGSPNQTLQAIVDWGTQVNGSRRDPPVDTAKTVDNRGRSAPNVCIIELASSQQVLVNDRFAVPLGPTTVLVNFIRCTGTDEVLQTILCEDPGLRTTKSTRARL